MTKERLYIFDTTLRDGAQTQGVDFSVENKHAIAYALDALGVDYVEGGWPGANPTDTEFFGDPPGLKSATFTAFGMTKRAGRSVSNDPVLSAVLNAETPAVCLVGKSHDYHVKVALGISLEENLESIRASIAAIAKKGTEAMFDAEHFFDGYKANPSYALDCVKAARDAGARWVVLCDTNGGTLPHEVRRIVGEIIAHIPGENLGIHTHNDTENAVANTLVAVDAGVRQIQGTLNGLGERCGNANLCSLLPTLLLKPDYAERFETGVSLEQLKTLTRISRLIDEILNQTSNRHQPYVGASAFAHKGGLHVSAVAKDPKTYEHIEPRMVGNVRHIPVSDQSGRANILARLADAGIKVDPKDPRVDKLLDKVKRREHQGYAYDAAPASFELMARRALKLMPDFFWVDSFRVLVERRHNALGKLVTISEATVRVTIGDETRMSVGEGNGPVNALDQALRKDLGKYQEIIDDLSLEDFKVRILNGGTGAVTRVLIDSRDSKGHKWSTVGVSPNIVDASFQALVESMRYKLVREISNGSLIA